MNFTTAEIAHLLDTGHHGPTCGVERVVIDPNDVRVGAGQLFVASAHPPPLGDTTLVLEDDIALRVPYLTERSWVGGTAVNGPSTEAIVRAMAGDARGRPADGPRVGVLGAVAPWATAALIRAGLSDTTEHRLPPPGPPDLREPPGTERFRLPLALLNHPDDTPLAVVLNRRHKGCTGTDAALLDPTALVITDLGDRHLAMLGPTGAITSAREVLDRVDRDATLVMPEAVADALREEAGFEGTAFPALSIFGVRPGRSAGNTDAGMVHVVGPWGELAIGVGRDGGALALPVGAAVAVGLAAGRPVESVRSGVEAAAQTLARSMATRLAEGPVVWDRSDATSFGDVSEAIAALAERSAPAKFLVLGPLDDGPTVTDRLHARLGALATHHQIVVRSAEAWGSGFSPFEHPQNEVDDLAAAGPGAVILVAGGGPELRSVRKRLLDRARVTT